MADTIDLSEIVEWTYERAEGDIVVYARDAREAVQTMREHGFKVVNMKRLKRTGPTLKERLEMEKKGGPIQ